MEKVTLDGDRYIYKDKVYPRVTDILAVAGQIDKRFYTSESAKRGQYVHRLTQYHDEDTLDATSIDVSLKGYYQAYLRFLQDLGGRLKIEVIEKPVVNTKLKYAGTPDREALLDGNPILLSYKTGQYERWHLLQEQAYRMCYRRQPECYAVYLKARGTYKFTKLEDDGAEQAWLACLVLYGWKEKK